MGLTIDVFSNTQGMNALACVVLAALYLFFLWVLYESYWAWGIFD